jgi:hypothetical protein
MFEIQLVLINKFGEFCGRKVPITDENYNKLLEMVKTFYNSGFELTLEDGSFLVFPPDVVAQSILKVVKIQKEDVQE